MEEFLEPIGGELVIVRQLPVIEDKMDEALASVQERLNAMSKLAVTSENYKELKKVRADLNKEFAHLEKLRKQVKDAVEAPYKKFETGAYKRMKDAYSGAIAQLDGNIKEVENGLKEQKQAELYEYYEDYRQSLGLDADIANARRSGIRVGLSDTIKSLKAQAKEFLDRVDGDLKMIDTLEDRDEIYVEYRQSLSVTDAVRIVNERHKMADELKKKREAEAEARKLREAQEAVVDEAIANEERKKKEDAVSAPIAEVTVEEVAEEEPVYPTTYLGYNIFGTLRQLKGMKQVMVNAMIDYCEREGMRYGKCEQ